LVIIGGSVSSMVNDELSVVGTIVEVVGLSVVVEVVVVGNFLRVWVVGKVLEVLVAEFVGIVVRPFLKV
jgi:hypothetical protein